MQVGIEPTPLCQLQHDAKNKLRICILVPQVWLFDEALGIEHLTETHQWQHVMYDQLLFMIVYNENIHRSAHTSTSLPSLFATDYHNTVTHRKCRLLTIIYSRLTLRNNMNYTLIAF